MLVTDLFDLYRQSSAFARVKPASKRHYNHMMAVAEPYIGGFLVSEVSPKDADALHAQVLLDRSESIAHSVVKTLRVVWGTAIRYDIAMSNPFSGLKIGTPKPREVLWTPGQVNALICKCDREGLPNLGTLVLTAYHMCQRPGDMRQLVCRNYDPNTHMLDFKQEKTGVRIELKATPMLQVRLNPVGGPDSPLMPNDKTGQMHTQWSYYKQAREMMNKAGLPDTLQLRDLRRTGATELGEAGATEDEIRAVTGHQSRAVLATYVRPTRKLGAAGQMKRFG